jgi:hypothetical protein
MGALIELNYYTLLYKGKLPLDCHKLPLYNGKVQLYDQKIIKMSKNFNWQLKLFN